MVHTFATKYFDLPQNHTAVIQNAVAFVDEAMDRLIDDTAGNKASDTKQYDFIVHDVFTGGAEPMDLFTFEFLDNLHKLLKPGGAIAIVCPVDCPAFRSPRSCL